MTLSRCTVSCRSLVDQCGSLGSCKPQIPYIYKQESEQNPRTNVWIKDGEYAEYHNPGNVYLQSSFCSYNVLNMIIYRILR